MKQTLIDAAYYAHNKMVGSTGILTLEVSNMGLRVMLRTVRIPSGARSKIVLWEMIESARHPLNPIVEAIDQITRDDD